MKTKYYYNKINGTVHRITANNEQSELMYDWSGKWTISAWTREDCLTRKDYFSPIAASVVRYFEQQGGYVYHLRKL